MCVTVPYWTGSGICKIDPSYHSDPPHEWRGPVSVELGHYSLTAPWERCIRLCCTLKTTSEATMMADSICVSPGYGRMLHPATLKHMLERTLYPHVPFFVLSSGSFPQNPVQQSFPPAGTYLSFHRGSSNCCISPGAVHTAMQSVQQ
ncbi:hypothetical protein RRG08_029137 [Elysia crispata]|uniref:Uncharacterized protein n=1 Tax=Elysia crispata TaxID=231223 RepID=A0AAE1CTW6_9GAST|nr:hypothetical protein RRG08_029137 [Elysia crispata]